LSEQKHVSIADLSAIAGNLTFGRYESGNGVMEPPTLLVGDKNALVFADSPEKIAEQRIRAELDLRCKVTDKCTKCGRTESQITCDAKTLGLLQEFQNGVYTCCQIAEWADEQWLAWLEATQEDSGLAEKTTGRPQFDEGDSESVLVPIRLRRRQVPWYRHP
jgi:hypothetical protein